MHHLQMDAVAAAYASGYWDLMIAHPPCTYLSRAGARWWRDPERQKKADEAWHFVKRLWDVPTIDRIAIENPIGQLNQRWRYPDQIIQPWEYGHPFSKATCLWLKNLPPLMPTQIEGYYEPLLPSNVGKGKRNGGTWHRGHTSSAKIASKTFPGVAAAMAEQWGGVTLPAQIAAAKKEVAAWPQWMRDAAHVASASPPAAANSEDLV